MRVHYIDSPLVPELGLLDCLEGQRRAYEWVAQQPDTLLFALILEDDVEFVGSGQEVLRFLSPSSIIPRLERYPLIKMYYHNQEYTKMPMLPPGPIYTDVCPCNGHVTSAVATVVAKRYADNVTRMYARAVPNAISNYFNQTFPMWYYDADVLLTHVQRSHNHGAWCPPKYAEEYGYRHYIAGGVGEKHVSLNKNGRNGIERHVTRAYLEAAVYT